MYMYLYVLFHCWTLLKTTHVIYLVVHILQVSYAVQRMFHIIGNVTPSHIFYIMCIKAFIKDFVTVYYRDRELLRTISSELTQVSQVAGKKAART